MSDPGNMSGSKPDELQHPLFGCLKGQITIAPGVDLTEPACPEWAELAEEKIERIAKALEESKAARK